MLWQVYCENIIITDSVTNEIVAGNIDNSRGAYVTKEGSRGKFVKKSWHLSRIVRHTLEVTKSDGANLALMVGCHGNQFCDFLLIFHFNDS